MRLASKSGVLAIVITAVLAPWLRADKKPQDLLWTAATAVKNAKTWQATITLTVSGAPSGPISMLYEVKRSGRKVWARVSSRSQAATGTAGGPHGRRMPAILVVDDGHSTISYAPELRIYSREPGGAGLGIIPFQQLIMRANGQTVLTTKGIRTLNGRPSYLIEGAPRPPNATKGSRLSIWIDQSTGRIVDLTSQGSTVARPGAPSHPQNLTMTVSNERLNEPIPDSLFHFTPPKYAREKSQLTVPSMAVPSRAGKSTR